MKKGRLESGKLFFSLFLLCFIPLFIITLLYSRSETHLFINRFHAPLADELFKYWTYLGDGLVLAAFILALLFVNLRIFLSGLIAYALGGLGAQFFKHVFFSGFARPVKYFELNAPSTGLHLVSGVDMHTWLSFPSGHTSSAFAVFFLLALFARKTSTQLLLFILAFGVAVSRVYLSQHFLMDVVAGAALGMLSAWLAWWWMQRYSNPKLDRDIRSWLKK